MGGPWWMGLVKAILGGDEVRNITSTEGRYGFGCVAGPVAYSHPPRVWFGLVWFAQLEA